jgi:hypothetical protein
LLFTIISPLLAVTWGICVWVGCRTHDSASWEGKSDPLGREKRWEDFDSISTHSHLSSPLWNPLTLLPHQTIQQHVQI